VEHIAAASTGVIKLNILITKNSDIDRNGSILFLFFNPGILRIRLVIKRFVNDKVDAVPVSNIATILKSTAPNPE
jgi:hypothetical protein